MFNKIFATAFFLKQFLHSPGKIGSICPSSKFLVHELVRTALEPTKSQCGLIIDLGAGSGVVSRALLDYGISPERILAVDISENFKNIFRKHCDGLELRTGDARNLDNIINRYSPSIPLQAVISSLPLRSLPGKIVSEIMYETRKVLRRRGGILIQYTYAFWMHSTLKTYGFMSHKSKFVPINFPPALVELYLP